MLDVGSARSLFAVRRATGVVVPLPVEAALTFRRPRDAGRVTIAPVFGGALVSGPPDGGLPSGRAADVARLEEALRTLGADSGAPRGTFSRPFTDADRPGLARETARGVPFWSVAAGSPLFHRLAARRAAERLEAQLGPFPDARPRPRGHLAGGDIASLAGEAAAVRAAGLSPRQARWLVERYGSRWRDVVELGDEPLGNDEVPVRGEVAFAVAQEGARTLSDLLLRWRAPELAEPGEEGLLAEAALSELARREAWPEPRRQRERLRWNRERALVYGSAEESATRLGE
jgi:glycerol-3-phosphate dehydrogenase